jgi:hypothetical protein
MTDICSEGIPDWLKQAVQDVVGELEAGARPLGIGAGHRRDLVVEFEDSFCQNLESKEDWEQNHESQVLQVARIHGRYATAFTILDGVVTGGSMPTELDTVMTGLAGLLVRHLHCPSLLLGIPCAKVSFLPESLRSQVPEGFGSLLEYLDEAQR